MPPCVYEKAFLPPREYRIDDFWVREYGMNDSGIGDISMKRKRGN